ncbi:hypothetical protein CASFOL_029151 [Castilleja foliolosa]|uniref:Uncharacterized protein n=1 Tax=Castilleja foliolosa TaxID=1961234 RepID=A0ABD3BK38_9LAMI
MASFVPFAFLLLQLSLLLSTDATLPISQPPAQAPHHRHHHHHHAPTPSPISPPAKPPTKPPVPVKPPTKPPVHPPVKPPVPSKPPTKPPSYPPVRRLLAVRGTVYCKPCTFKGVHTLTHAEPLANATVKLQCNNTKIPMVEQKMTDKNGFFYFTPKRVTTMAFHKCKVFLVKSPSAKCTVPTSLNGGTAGAILIPDRKPINATATHQFFNVGPFAFDSPTNCTKY